MLDFRENEITIVESLKAYLSSNGFPCEVVRRNQVSEAPTHPYVAYTITTPIHAHQGTYSQSADGTLYKNALQTWSFTTQSHDQEEALKIAMLTYDFFSAVGVIMLADKNITVRSVGTVTTRDNLLTIQYEYRNGLDIMFGFLYSIAPTEEVIETISFKEA